MIRNRAGHRIWTPEDDAILRAGWAAGRPVRAIAEEIGITKNAAMGRAHRLKLEGRPSPIKRARPSSAFNHSAAAVRRGLQQQASPRVSPAKTARAPEAARAGGVSSLNLPTPPGSPPLGGVGVLFGEAKSTQCAYPLWGSEKPMGGVVVKRYTCGQPTTRCVDGKPSPYCAGHHARCFVRRAAPAASSGAAAA
ncbi:MAG: hypothetical protein O9320_08740 [Magnetospirillum sp.]|nr:hypothetical protein [Magnetospirillum sp.]